MFCNCDRQTNSWPYWLNILFSLLQQTGRPEKQSLVCLISDPIWFATRRECDLFQVWSCLFSVNVCVPFPSRLDSIGVDAPLRQVILPWCQWLSGCPGLPAWAVLPDSKSGLWLQTPGSMFLLPVWQTARPFFPLVLTSGVVGAAGLLLTKSLEADGCMLCSRWKSWLPPLQFSEIFPIGRN